MHTNMETPMPHIVAESEPVAYRLVYVCVCVRNFEVKYLGN